MDTREGQQLNFLEKHFPDVAKGWKWLQANNDKFEKEVFGPPAIVCTVKDKRYSDLVQASLQKDDFMCFTTQSRQDHKTLSDYFYKQLGLSVSIRTCLASYADILRLSREQAASLGFDCYAIDCITGPDPVLAMLCNEKKLHLTGVALKDIDERQYHTLMGHDKIMAWVTGRQYYRVVRRRELGPDAVSTTTREIQPGRWWNDDVDTSAKDDLQKRLDEEAAKFTGLKADSQKNKETVVNHHAKLRELAETLVSWLGVSKCHAGLTQSRKISSTKRQSSRRSTQSIVVFRPSSVSRYRSRLADRPLTAAR